MPEIIPFIGVRYNQRLCECLNDVLAPPYNAISPKDQEDLYQRHERNLVRLIMGKEQLGDDDYSNKYNRAANFFAKWKTENVLTEDEKACYYIYEQEFVVPGEKQRRKRRGFSGLLRLEPLQKGSVLAHEQTFHAPKLDRLKLIRACQANFCNTLMIYHDREKESDQLLAEAAAEQPEVEFTDQSGVVHRLWLMCDAMQIQQVRALMKAKKLLIAEGHHRYECAIQYSVEMQRALPKSRGPHAFNYLLAHHVNAEDQGVVALPIHRVLNKDLGLGVGHDEVLEDLGRHYTMKPFSVEMSESAKAAACIRRQQHQNAKVTSEMIMLFPDGRAYVLTLKPDADLDEMIENEQSHLLKRMPVNLVQQHIIPLVWIGNPEIEIEQEDVFYPHTIEQVLTLLNSKQGCAAFILKPIEIEDIVKVAEQGERMPQNSTYFYPPLISGLVMRDMRLRI